MVDKCVKTYTWRKWAGKFKESSLEKQVVGDSLLEIKVSLRNTIMAPEVGLEPTTSRLTAARSTIELLWSPYPYSARTRNLQAPSGSVKRIPIGP